MKQLFYYIIIRLTTRHAVNAVKIYETLYHKSTSPEVKKKSPLKTEGKTKPTKRKNHPKFSVNPKKQEILDSLEYLKKKEVKSKQDKSSISMLEGILATM